MPAVSYSESKSTEFRMHEGEQSSTNSPFKLSYANSGVLKLQDEQKRKSKKRELIFKNPDYMSVEQLVVDDVLEDLE